MSATLRRTPLFERHVAAGARMVPFAGWEMPVQYEGVIPEHLAVRSDAGVFDVSHMGQLHVEGPATAAFLQSVLSNDIDRVGDGEAQYTLLTNDDGGIVDDLIVYRMSHGHYFLVVNAGNREAAYSWLKEREVRGTEVRDASDDYALVAVQGPAVARPARPRRRQGVHARDGRGRRDRGDGLPDGLHGREGRRAPVRRPRTVRRCGTPSSSAASSRAGSARATRCAWRSATRSTATTSRPRPTRSRPGSAGPARSTPTSRARTRSGA